MSNIFSKFLNSQEYLILKFEKQISKHILNCDTENISSSSYQNRKQKSPTYNSSGNYLVNWVLVKVSSADLASAVSLSVNCSKPVFKTVLSSSNFVVFS